MLHKNVFERRGPEKKKRPGLLETSRDPTKGVKHYKNMHLTYKAMKASRELSDVAPDVSALPGGLINPSNPSAYQPLDPASLRRTSSGLPPETGPEALFVPDNGREPLLPHPQGEATKVPDADFWETTREVEQVTCYFWFHNGGICGNRQNCTFLHRARSDILVAARPGAQHKMSEDSGVGPRTCHFWNLNGTCTNGDKCKYLHHREVGIPVAPPPGHRNEMQSPVQEDAPESDHHWNDVSEDTTVLQSPEPALQSRSPWQDNSTRPEDNASSKLQFICYFFHNNGSCIKGESCNYLHTTDPTVPVASNPLRTHQKPPKIKDNRPLIDSYRPDLLSRQRDDEGPPQSRETDSIQAPEISDLTSIAPTGIRLPQKSISFANDDPISASSGPTRPPWDPRDPFRAICFFWHKVQKCSNVKCKYFHTTDPLLPLSPDPSRPKVKTCRYWVLGTCHETQCNYLHGFIEATPGGKNAARDTNHGATEKESQTQPTIPTGPRQKSVKFASDPPMPFVEHLSDTRNATGPNSLPIISNSHVPQPDEQPRSQSQPQPQLELQQSPVYQNAPSIPESKPMSTSKAKKPAVSFMEYQRKQAVKALGNRAKKVTFGDNEQSVAILDIGDLGPEAFQPWGQIFSTLPTIRFDQECIVQDFELYYSRLQHLPLRVGSFIPADSANSEASKIVDKVAQTLRLRLSGMLAILPHFIILSFPARVEEWKFLEKSIDYPREVRLRYLVFQSHQDIKPGLRHSTEENPGPRAAPYRKALMKNVHDLSVARLLPALDKDKDKGKNPYVFYLLFPSASTANFVFSWLQTSNSYAKILSSQTDGSWDFFVKAFDVGVVLVHESLASELCNLPKLSEVLQKRVMFWCISDSSSPYPIFPSEYSPGYSKLGRLTTTRLFPHGATILLTPSFIIAEPEKTFSLLQWFFGPLAKDGINGKAGKIHTATSGTWKIVCCYNFINYLLEVANAKSLERDQFYEANKDKPSKDAEATQKGLGYEKCNGRYEIYNYMLNLQISNRLGPLYDDIDYYTGTADEKQSPLVFADRYIDPDDERALVEWYAGWSMGRLDLFRRFHVVGTSLENAPKASRLKELPISKANNWQQPMDLPSTLFSGFSFPKPTTTAATKPIHMTPQMQKALTVAAKLSSPKEDFALSPATKSPQTPVGVGTTTNSPAMSGSDMSMIISSPNTTDNIHRHKAHGVSPRDYSGVDLDSEIVKFIAENSKPQDRVGEIMGNAKAKNNARELPRLTTSHLNTHASPNSAVTVATSAEPHLFSPENAYTSPYPFDGAGDGGRPVSSGTDGSRRSSHSGIVDENGKRMVPRSVRPSGTVRKEIPVKPGYTPIEDKSIYRNRRVINGIPQYELGSNPTSAVDSPIVGSPAPFSALTQTMEDKMNIDSDEMTAADDMEGGVTEQLEWKDIQLEATTTWYKNLLAQGGGWNHISVDGWEKQWKVLGIAKK